jgi:hypothetical protein
MKKNPDRKKANTISRRKAIKNLVLLPVSISLFPGVVKAYGAFSPFSGMKDLSADRNPDATGKMTEDPFVANLPVGKGQGIFPGRVSWVWNPAATNPSCANLPLSAGMSEDKYDAWFMDKNTNQDVVDKMLAEGLCSISGKKNTADAWNSIFKYHNKKRGKGDLTYKKGEKNIPEAEQDCCFRSHQQGICQAEGESAFTCIRDIPPDCPCHAQAACECGRCAPGMHLCG